MYFQDMHKRNKHLLHSFSVTKHKITLLKPDKIPQKDNYYHHHLTNEGSIVMQLVNRSELKVR